MAERKTSLLGLIVGSANVIGVLLIWLIMALMCSDVLSRNLLNQPIPGVSDMVASAVVLIVFLQLASAVRDERLTRVEFLYANMLKAHPRVARAMDVSFNLVGAAICVGIAYWTIPRLDNAWTGSEFVGNIGIMTFPRWPMPAVVLFGSCLAAIQFLAKIHDNIFGTRATREVSES